MLTKRIASFLSTVESFPLTVGRQVARDRVAGYHIDMSSKAAAPRWPPGWPYPPGAQPYDELAQMALGSHERYLGGQGEPWLVFARQVGDFMVANQTVGGQRDGGWIHTYDLGHTFPLRPPSLSAMVQGQGASLLVRLHAQTGDERYGEAASRALKPLAVPTAAGGVRAMLDGLPFPEEYPTRPASFVLNGAIFAIWGYYDVGVGLGDELSMASFRESVDMLSANIQRWDTGHWSRYDLFPHPVPNVSSFAYHALHINQLRAMHRLADRPELTAAIGSFERYSDSRAAHARAFAGKALFRLAVPRSRRLARLWPGHIRRAASRR